MRLIHLVHRPVLLLHSPLSRHVNFAASDVGGVPLTLGRKPVFPPPLGTPEHSIDEVERHTTSMKPRSEEQVVSFAALAVIADARST